MVTSRTPAALLAGRQPKPDEQVGFAGAGVTDQHNRSAGVRAVPGCEVAEGRGLDGGDGVDVEVGESFQAWELGVVMRRVRRRLVRSSTSAARTSAR